MAEEGDQIETDLPEDDALNRESDDKNEKTQTNKRKRFLKQAASFKKRGVCYLSRVPPHMDPLKLRQILSQYGEIQRIYLTPEDPAAQVHRKKAGGFRGKEFSEGWVEFSKKSVARKVANMLNGEQIGGKRRSSFYYDLWNIKYLSKFKWDNLTEELAFKNATQEQKLALEMSAAKRERDFYLSKVDKSRALKSIKERVKKKQKSQGLELEAEPRVIRKFPQKRPVTDDAAQSKKARLSKDILSGIFGESSS
eukprot:TRINITY_DN1490_c0_g2_i1.p1 TRINITY_DN1490_c0_g2~~TRINITY_DN1490_c0_g2_i1.p1  ORF type:complete len:252 (-),score=56.76 TRINITY_DN1490_c0_g2_i1:222-977(-)